MPPKSKAKEHDDSGLSSVPLPRTCGAVVRGKYCKLPEGHNTDHPGVGLCYKHGGNRVRSLRRAGIALAHDGIMNPDIHPGEVVEIEPHNALLWAVMIAGGDVTYWQNRLQDLGLKRDQAEAQEDVEAIENIDRQIDKVFKEVRIASKEMRSAGKMAIDAGLAERQVVMAERMAHMLTTFARNLFARMDLPTEVEKQLPRMIHEEIMALETPMGEVKEKPKLALVGKKKSQIFDEV